MADEKMPCHRCGKTEGTTGGLYDDPSTPSCGDCYRLWPRASGRLSFREWAALNPIATSPSAELAGGKPSRTDRCPPPDVEREETMAELRVRVISREADLKVAKDALETLAGMCNSYSKEIADLRSQLAGDPSTLSRVSDLKGDLDLVRESNANLRADVRVRDQQIELLQRRLKEGKR